MTTAMDIKEARVIPAIPDTLDKGKLWPRDVFSWKDRAAYAADVPLDATQDMVMEEIPWDLVIWWNSDLAESSIKFAECGELIRSVPEGWLPTYEETYLLIGRLPRSDKRAIDHLTYAVGHLVASVEDVTGRPLRIYDSSTGVWLAQGTHSHKLKGVTPVTYVDNNIDQFMMALHRAVDFLQALVNFHAPMPKKPSRNATDAERDDYAKALARRNYLQNPLNEAHALGKAYFKGKFRSVRADLRERLSANQDHWDSETRWLVLGDCVLDLNEIQEHGRIEPQPFSPFHLSTMRLAVNWKGQLAVAGASEWEKGVAKLIPDPDTRRYLQKRYGVALLGTPGLAGKSLVWQYGTGDTGKSTLQECIAGKDGVFSPYAVQDRLSTLTTEGQKLGGADRFMAYARGKRFAIMSELDQGSLLSAETVKSLTGGDTVTGTAKFANSINYSFTATIFVASNHPPAFPSGDTALQERIQVVPFKTKMFLREKCTPEQWAEVPEDRRADPGWKEHVLSSPTERTAILRWVVDGLLAYCQDGGMGAVPEAMRDEREMFVGDADPVVGLVRSLLGEEGDLPQVLKVMTDEEWQHRGLRNHDGVFDARLAEIIRDRAVALGMGNSWGEVSAPVINSARMLLNDRGGKRTVIKDPVTKKATRGMSRAVEVSVLAEKVPV